MNRIVRRAAAAALLAGGLGSVGCAGTGGTVARGAAPDGCPGGGCGGGAVAGGYAGGSAGGYAAGGGIYRNWVDPCWPERYNAAARAEVLAPFAAQVHNGHVLNQTVWNWYFEPGSDTLTPAGMAKLDSIAKTRPGPDPRLFLQTARDVAVTQENMDRVNAHREDLNGRRAAAVQRYMASQPTAQPVVYELFVLDPVVPGIHSEFSANSYRGQGQGYRGGIGGGSGTSATGTGGGGQTPAATSIGTGPGGPPAAGPSAPAPSPGGAAGPGGQ